MNVGLMRFHSLNFCVPWFSYFSIVTLVPFLAFFLILEGNRPYHGFRRHLDGWAKRSEITVFVWESDGK